MYRMKDDINCDAYKDLNIALVLSWVCRSWKLLAARIISRCFARCGFIKGMVGSTLDTQEPKLSEHEQQLQNLEQAVSFVFYPLAEPSDIMRDAKINVHLRTPSVEIVPQSRVGNAIVDTDEKPAPTSARVKDYLEDLIVYATLRGGLEFLKGKVSMSGYFEIVALRARDQSIQTKITDFFPSRE